MKKDNDYLNIDLEFLDKKKPTQDIPKQSNTGQTPPVLTPVSTGYKYNWKNILIISGIILFIGWVLFSDDSGSSSSSNNTPPPPSKTSNYGSNTGSAGPSTNTAPPAKTSDNSVSDDNVDVGEYSCSRYHYDQAVLLDPDETEEQIESARIAYDSKERTLNNLKNKIDNSYVNEYSYQWEIDDYNEDVDRYNSLLSTYKRDLAVFNARIDKYNAQIQKHNNYLMTNCTKKY